jgi:Ca2+-binding RTX toxin-like protein
MVKFKIYDGYSADMTDLNLNLLFSGDPDIAKKKLYVLDFGGGDRIEFKGVDFKYDKQGVPAGGEVHSFTLFSGGEKAMSLDGIEAAVKIFVKAAETESDKDDLQLLAKLLLKNDAVSGHDLDDTLVGEGGKDVIYGGGGADSLSGGSASDRFLYRLASDSTVAHRDTIEDFSRSQHDKINLSAVATFDFVGNTDTFSGTGAEVGYVIAGGDTIVNADADGDGDIDLSILLNGAINLTEGDFIL